MNASSLPRAPRDLAGRIGTMRPARGAAAALLLTVGADTELLPVAGVVPAGVLAASSGFLGNSGDLENMLHLFQRWILDKMNGRECSDEA